MNSNNKNKMLVLLLVTIAFTGMIGCSSQSGGGSGTAAGLGAGTPSVQYNGNQSISPCSHDVAGIADLSVSLETYTTNGVSNPNWVRVKYNVVPAGVASGTTQLAFWAYSTDPSGNPLPMQNAAFFVERNNGGGNFVQISSQTTTLSWTALLAATTAAGITATDAATVMSQVTFVVPLDGALQSVTMLTSALYLNGLSAPDRYVQALIPQFYANPNIYAQTHNSYLLHQHPLYNLMGSGYTEANYAAAAQAMCF